MSMTPKQTRTKYDTIDDTKAYTFKSSQIP